ncbi:MAG: hypothetical protein ACTSRD_10415, partial [Promethearchaeota archaeon]
MKRYSSIDFLRGLAIFLMIFVHTMMRWVDRAPIMSDMGSYSLFAVIFFIAVLFMGAWTGLFLMVSATGNMMSMHSSLERNPKVRTTVSKQIIGGFLLLLAAMVTESITGYGGYMGSLALGNPESWQQIFYNGFHFETVHAVAWAVILNGITQGILSINGGWKKINRNITIYIILAILVVVVTPSVWKFAAKVIEGYPYQHRSFTWEIFGQSIPVDSKVQMGYLGYDSIGRLLLLTFLGPLAAPVEPLFPFLAVSYIGSIIALFIIRKRKEMEGFDGYDVSPMKNPSIWLKRIFKFLLFASFVGFITFGVVWQFSVADVAIKFKNMQRMIGSFMIFSLVGIVLFYFRRKERETSEYKRHTLPLKIGMLVGFTLFVVGLLGTVLVVFLGPDPNALEVILGSTYNVRGLEATSLWLWWFCVVTGAQIGCFCLLIRGTEFRGKGRQFGKKTLWFRRFGIVPFSIYNFQFLDVLAPLFLGAIGVFIPLTDKYAVGGVLFPEFGLNTYGVYGIWFVIILIFLMYWLLLWLWEKAHYIFGFEWFLGKIGGVLIPSKRKDALSGEKIPWWHSRKLKESTNPDWIELIPEEQIPRQELVDSKLSLKIGLLGILIAPLSLVGLGIAITGRKKEGKNAYNLWGMIFSIFGAVLAAGILIGTMFI